LYPGLTINITPPDGRHLGAFPLHSPELFSASREQCDVRIGPNTARGDLHSYQIYAEGNGLGVNLSFTGSVPPWRPGVGKNYYSADLSRYFAWLPAIPYGTVEGTLTYDGKSHAVKGVGYHDHNWGNVGLNDVMSHWVWGRAHLGDYTLIFVEMVSAPAYNSQKLPVFLLAKGDKILIGDGAPLKYIEHSSKRQYPQQIDFNWQTDSGQVQLKLRQPRIIEAASLLGSLPWWKRTLARLVANPYYFRFSAQLDLEINLPEAKDHLQGEALYELMLLR
jgi:predicted secreted hydrolase